MIVVDTNVLSAVIQSKPDDRVERWLSDLRPKSGVMCAPVLNELLFLAEKHTMRHRSDRVARQFGTILEEKFSDDVLPFDERAARICAFVRAQQVVRGQTRQAYDMMIAAICMVNQLPLATCNLKDFEGLGLEIVDPRVA